MSNRYFYLLFFLCAPCVVLSLPDQLDRKKAVAEEKLRGEENFAFVGEVLYLTSSLTNTFSDEIFLLNSLEHTLKVFNQEARSVTPGYDFGYSLAFHYRAAPSRTDLELKYGYIHNSGTDHFIRDVTDENHGIRQRNMQNDRGHLHAHLHIFDFLVGHNFPFYQYLLLKFFGGLTVNDFHYFFTFENQDQIISTSIETGENVGSTMAHIFSKRKFRFCGWGPKVGIHFGYHFFPSYQRHEFSLYSSFQFSILFARKWGKGGYSGQVVAPQSIMGPVIEVLPLSWRDELKARIVPHMHLDFSARYRYYFANAVSISLTAGFRALAYWDLDEVNRAINYNLETLASIPPRAESDIDSMIFSGPYLSISVAF
ncbi:MAG: Lpg1974 family pore-forming outer membrane protein [Chlamydiota bacterium]